MSKSTGSKFVDNYVTFREPVCNSCIHHIAGTLTCDAFPDRIPAEIIGGKNDHKTPLDEQDNDIVYEPEK